tara:strand:- start:1349 stop:2170 length:822 start_codon:yes stop_codon:yes gene_type:complete
MGQFLSQCEKSPLAGLGGGGGGSSAMNVAGVEDIKRNVTNKFEEHKNISSKQVHAAQNVKIKQVEGANLNSPMYLTDTNEYGFFGQRTKGPCPNYGCAYTIDQSIGVELYTFNETIVKESENIWNDIKMKLKQEAENSFDGNSSALDAANKGIAAAEDDAIKNIEKILTNMSKSAVKQQQNIMIEYTTPIKCQDPCGKSMGPTLKQDAQIVIKTEDIINSTMEIVQKKLADHDVDVEQKTSQSNTACIAQIASVICSSIICIIVLWMIKGQIE